MPKRARKASVGERQEIGQMVFPFEGFVQLGNLEPEMGTRGHDGNVVEDSVPLTPE